MVTPPTRRGTAGRKKVRTMNKQDIIRKLTSRKFIISIISALAGVAIALIGHEQEVTAVSGALMSIIPAAVYCIMEGHIDAASVKSVGDDAVKAEEEPNETEDAENFVAFSEVAITESKDSTVHHETV